MPCLVRVKRKYTNEFIDGIKLVVDCRGQERARVISKS
jgi:hypothetical protein